MSNKMALDALKGAREWLEGWASAEPYIGRLDRAIAALEQTEEAAAPSKWGPSEIFLQLHGEDEPSESVDYTDNVTWCWHRIHDSDVRYVRADLAAATQPQQAKEGGNG